MAFQSIDFLQIMSDMEATALCSAAAPLKWYQVTFLRCSSLARTGIVTTL
jgi:hypothetical protein